LYTSIQMGNLNSAFYLHCVLSKSALLFRRGGTMVSLEGFGPSTTCLEGRCSIQLSYRETQTTIKFYDKIQGKTRGGKFSRPVFCVFVLLGTRNS
jgi:hypothetical protein